MVEDGKAAFGRYRSADAANREAYEEYSRQALLLRRRRPRKWQVAHLSAAAAGAGERRCDWNPSRRTGGGRVRYRVVE